MIVLSETSNRRNHRWSNISTCVGGNRHGTTVDISLPFLVSPRLGLETFEDLFLLSMASKPEDEKKAAKQSAGRRRIESQPYHYRQELCKTRPEYRRGKQERAVKVFTIAEESRYLLVQNVPDLKEYGREQKEETSLESALVTLCSKFGSILSIESVDCDSCAEFTYACLLKFERFSAAVQAKKRLDDHEFYGSILHVTYAPEFETTEDLHDKLQARKRFVGIKLTQISNLSQQYFCFIICLFIELIFGHFPR